MRKSNREVNGEKVFRYSIRKYHFGAASVAVAALMFFANGAVKADALPVSPVTANTEKVNAGVTELTEGVPPKENPIEKSKEEVVGDKTPVAQKLVDKSPLVQAISELQAAIAKVDEESLVSLSNQLIQLTDENNRLLNGENISEEAIASQVSRVQFLTEQVRQLHSKTEDKASNKEDRSGSKVQDKKEFEVSENAVTLVNQTAEIKKSVKDDKVEEVFTNKTKLETLLKEIDKLEPEKYTEDSVKGLKEKVAKAKEVLTIAKNQEEVNSVYKELVNYKNSSLRRVRMTHKPLEENTPKLDTTNGKETVGKKAQNTEPNDRNIAGHNHILNGITLPEGSGLRAAPNNANFRYETDGADLSSLVAGEELGYGKKVIIKVRYDKSVISSRDINITTTPNTGPRIEYTNKYRDGIAPFDGGSNVKLVGQIPNDMIGTYDLHVHILNNKNSNSQITTLKIPITVKPKKPTVSVADLVNAEGKKPVVTATVANTSISKVEFYLNGQKQTEVNATNGQATWTPTNALRENDRITVKNIAKGGIPPRDAYGNTFTTRETASDMSDPVVIPKAPKPAFDLGAEKSNAKAELGRIAQAEITAINGDKSLTTTEKTAKVQEVNTKKTQGEQAIDAASVNDADKVAQAKETAKTAIEGVHTPGNLATVKSNAKAELGRIAQAEITAINGDKSLTTTEKTAKVQEVNTKKTQGEQAIDAASVNDADKVAQAKETAKTAIEGVHTPGNLATVKSNAKAALEEAAKAEKSEIASDNSVTSADRVTQTNAVDTKKTEAEGQITSAVDADAVAAAKTAGEAAIRGVHNNGDLESLKTAAKALPNTGTVKSTLAIPVAITSALLSLGLVGGRRRKEDEEV
ncbi:DUF1542 domain-containing protein [Streptococcus sp. UMB0029]|uniref:DUF1542 domain-containing protein n=1 Tax=Streptococcus sp. UMB0029 TaxID=2069308 RepID=UPI000C801158|nr:DUF1542 domain-containing protein [Streptococcus sp. UMB0029]PMB99645.1 hypothetical protein CJ239_10845 [Streptococcus sp. UMB0029]